MSTQLATSNIYSARPTLFIDGQEAPSLSDGVQNLIVQETKTGLYNSEITVGNWGNPNGKVSYLYFDRQLIDFGKKIEIMLGESNTAEKVFEGKVTGIEGRFLQNRSPEINILAEDRLQDLRMTRRTRSFEDVSDSDLFQRIASEHGLQTNIDIDGPSRYRVLCQVNQSDLAFLQERARMIDAELWVKGNTLYAQAHNRRNEGEVVFSYGQRLREFSVLADLSSQCTSLTVSGWSVTDKENLANGTDKSSIQSELDAREICGSDLLQNKFGNRLQQVVHHVPHNRDEARYFAESAYRRIARRFVAGHATLEGDGRLRVGMYVVFNGLGQMFSGRYYVTSVRHLFDIIDGYRTVVDVERPGIGVAQ